MIESFPADVDLATRLKRARMRAWRRGMREMDLILGGYIDRFGANFGAERMTAFEAILARRDQDLYDFISNRCSDALNGLTEAETLLLADIRQISAVFDGQSS